MDQREPGSGEPELTLPDEMVKDLEPDEHEAEAVTGGNLPSSGLKGESQDDTYKGSISIGP